MAVNRLKPPRNLRIEFKPSPRQYELWKLLQPNYCPHCGGEIEQILIDYGFAEADTTYGKVGVKVWIYKGEVLPTKGNKEGGVQ